LTAFARRAGLARVMVLQGTKALADVGDRGAIAPGTADVRLRSPVTVKVSTVTASEFARDLASSPSVEVVVQQGGGILGASRPVTAGRTSPRRGAATLGGSRYRAVTQAFKGFGDEPVDVTVLSNLSATSGSVGESRLVAAVIIAAFLVL